MLHYPSASGRKWESPFRDILPSRRAFCTSNIFVSLNYFIMVFYKLTQNKQKGSVANGKWYARTAVIGRISWKELCRHIATHGSVYTEDVCVGVGMKILECVMEKLGEGYSVRFGDMGTFRLSLKSEGTESVSEFNAAHNIKGCYLRFLPNRSKRDAVDLSSPALRARFSFGDINSKMALAAALKKQEEEEG